jgi:hypothetical protein
MLRSCKAGSLVQVQVRAPIRSLSSFGRAPTWYVGGGRIEACREHHAPVAQLVGGISLRTRAVRVRISPGAPFLCPRSPTGRGPALNAGQCRFEACRGYAPVAQSAEAAASRAACCRFESCAAHQFRLPSPSGKGIWPTPRHSAVRVRQGAPFKQQPCKRVREVRAAADNRVVGGAVPPACTNQGVVTMSVDDKRVLEPVTGGAIGPGF